MRVLAYLGISVLVIAASGATWYWLMTPEETVPWEVAAPEETAPYPYEEEAAPYGYEREVMPNGATSDAEEKPFVEEMTADEAAAAAEEEQEEEVRYYAIQFLTLRGNVIFSSTSDDGEIYTRENAFAWTDRDGVTQYLVPSSDGIRVTMSEVVEPIRPPPPPPPPPPPRR